MHTVFCLFYFVEIFSNSTLGQKFCYSNFNLQQQQISYKYLDNNFSPIEIQIEPLAIYGTPSTTTNVILTIIQFSSASTAVCQ